MEMMVKYNPQIYNRRSLRLPEYDYSQNGAYFVTICTEQRQCWFGEVVDGVMKYNHFGAIVADSWVALAERYEYITLDQWVVMPNHFHGILHIDKLPHQLPIKTKSLGSLIGSFKTTSAKQINKICEMQGQTVWQRNFYEHIIRNEKSLDTIREYIVNNPLKWHLDLENPSNIPHFQEIIMDIPF